jgi:hypothetical protein
MALWTRRSEQISWKGPGTPRRASEGEVIHSCLWFLERLSAGLQRLRVDRNAADRGGLYAAFRMHGYTNREAMDSVNRILPRQRGNP